MFESSLGNPEIFWLNTTNAVLGIVTLICCMVIARAVLRDVLHRGDRLRDTDEEEEATR